MKKILYNASFVAGFVFISFLVYLLYPAANIEAVTKYSEYQIKALDLMVEMNKLLISLSLLILGATGGIAVGKFQITQDESFFSKILFILSALFSMLSIFWGYVFYRNLVNFLINEIFNLNNNLISISRNLQFICLLLSLFFLIWYFFNLKIIKPSK